MRNMAPGFGFYPTEEELVGFYLHNKLEKKIEEEMDPIIPVVDIFSLDPWNLPQIAEKVCHGDSEDWFFFCPRQEREAHGGRPNRITPSGYWKATGTPSSVFSSSNRVIGVKKSMVFYTGKAPLGEKTKWKLNEYRALEDEATALSTPPKVPLEYSLCRVYVKSGSMRSFDRRPTAASTSGTADTQKDKMVCETEYHYQEVQMANSNVEGVSSQETHSDGVKISSQDSSSSGDDQAGPSIELTTTDDLNDFWDSLDNVL